MNREQAKAFQAQNSLEQLMNAKGITEALALSEGDLIVRDTQGRAVAITNRQDFAISARIMHSGTVYSRRNWRSDPAPLF